MSFSPEHTHLIASFMLDDQSTITTIVTQPYDRDRVQLDTSLSIINFPQTPSVIYYILQICQHIVFQALTTIVTANRSNYVMRV